MSLCVALDFDGVIVDTVQILYDVYAKILRKWGIVGSNDEFQVLNGLNMDEIVDYLIRKHKLSVAHSELKESYSAEIDKMYENVVLNQGISELLGFLHSKQIQIAVVSGGGRTNIEKVLCRYGISDFFTGIISGDDVKKAKPSKDIYEFLKSKIPDSVYVAVEDSYNGVISAKEAGINVVFYDAKSSAEYRCVSNSHYVINDFSSLRAIVYAIEKRSFSVTRIAKSTELSFVKKTVSFDYELEQSLDRLWAEALLQNDRLFNGKIVCYCSCKMEQDIFRVNYFESDYKHFRFKDKVLAKSGIMICPLAVSGIIIDRNNDTLIGTRDKVTQYDGWVELIPSGSISFNAAGEVNSPYEQILLELNEESNIENEFIQDVEAFCLVYDEKDDVYDIGLKIFIKDGLSELLSTGIISSTEYKDIQVIGVHKLIEDIFSFRIAPTSAALLCQF